MDKEEWVTKYLVEHKTLEEIGKEYGITRQGVYHFVKKYGLSVKDAENIKFKCDMCGEDSTQTRKRYSRSIKHFCSGGCYKEYLRNDGYTRSRTGQRLARYIMSKHLCRELRFGEVVHHNDSDNTNNALENLTLFSSASEHLKHHHRVRQGDTWTE